VNLLDVVARLAAAVFLGAVIGINRELHDKPAGLRTHALVGLGSALAVVSVAALGANAEHSVDAVSRVVQGIVTGIGFLGGGVILRHPSDSRVQGLTTAATIWLTALFGVACGTGAFREVVVGAVLVFLVLMIGGPLEKAIHGAIDRSKGRPQSKR
jgi:putative Mg2+ transporter-C (MgtC) family protein